VTAVVTSIFSRAADRNVRRSHRRTPRSPRGPGHRRLRASGHGRRSGSTARYPRGHRIPGLESARTSGMRETLMARDRL